MSSTSSGNATMRHHSAGSRPTDLAEDDLQVVQGGARKITIVSNEPREAKEVVPDGFVQTFPPHIVIDPRGN